MNPRDQWLHLYRYHISRLISVRTYPNLLSILGDWKTYRREVQRRKYSVDKITIHLKINLSLLAVRHDNTLTLTMVIRHAKELTESKLTLILTTVIRHVKELAESKLTYLRKDQS